MNKIGFLNRWIMDISIILDCLIWSGAVAFVVILRGFLMSAKVKSMLIVVAVISLVGWLVVAYLHIFGGYSRPILMPLFDAVRILFRS